MDRRSWRLQSTGSQRVGHDWVTNTFAFMLVPKSQEKSSFTLIIKKKTHLANPPSPKNHFFFLSSPPQPALLWTRASKSLVPVQWSHCVKVKELQSHRTVTASHYNTLAWKIPWMVEPGRLQFMGSLGVGWLSDFPFTFLHWRGNGNPLEYCCLENPRDRRAWWAVVYVVAQSRTRLKQLNISSNRIEGLARWYYWQPTCLPKQGT